jgi:hypothetical protein
LGRWARWLPGAALGVFIARVLGEAVGLPGVGAAVALSAALGSLGAWLLARWPLGRTWPALLLLAYVIQPEVLPSVRAETFFVTLVALVLNELGRRAAAGRGGDATRIRPTSWLVSALLFVAFLALYIITLAPDVLAADSGELQVVAAQLGVAHPPGFPLYVLLAHLMTRPAHWLAGLHAVNSAVGRLRGADGGRRLRAVGCC